MIFRLRHILSVAVSVFALMPGAARGVAPVDSLLERVCQGASQRIVTEIRPSDTDFFEISSIDGKPLIAGNSPVSVAAGLNHYLKYTAGVHLTHDNMTAVLPEVMPLPDSTERHDATTPLRYYMNYCTFSYSMPFASREEWLREIDWMALHGINLPLVAVGASAVWQATLERLGYTPDEARAFVSGPAFRAWWLMNNLEGWGGPVSGASIERDAEMQRFISAEMERWGMMPVVPGYAGMVPHDAASRLGLDVADPGLWCGFVRPAFLTPTDPRFAEIARIYYEEADRVFGRAKYYSMDPFHEGGNKTGVNLQAAGRAIYEAMNLHSPGSRWVIQGWQENPDPRLVADVPQDAIVELDLHAETRPKWTIPDGHSGRPWLWCMLLNFGGNTGLHGKWDVVARSYYEALSQARGLEGIGLTMEGFDNNPMMYELASELPWLKEAPEGEEWIARYARARYGTADADAEKAWRTLRRTIYNAPAANRQQGTTESPFCMRPTDKPRQASSWCNPEDYYSADSVIAAAHTLLAAAPRLGGNDNYRYDLVDVTRQAVAEKARTLSSRLADADSALYRRTATDFMRLLAMQDSLLASRPELMVGTWIKKARDAGSDDAEKNLNEWNARTLITVWGPRQAAESLHDYSNREWSGLLADFYAPRWQRWFDARLSDFDGPQPEIDFFAMEEEWTRGNAPYPWQPYTDEIAMARRALELIDSIP